MFNQIYNKSAQLESYIGDSDRYNETTYGDVKNISVIKYGPKQYKRGIDNESVYADYIYQTTEVVNVKDKIDGYIVVKVNEHFDIFGNFQFREVFVNNG